MKNYFKLLILSYIFCTSGASAQTYLISFAGSGESTTVTTVKVENLTSGTSGILNGNQILRLNVVLTDINPGKNEQSSELKIYPNPMTGNSIMQVCPPASGNAFITVSDINGKQIARMKSYLENYLQEFHLSGFPGGFYLISVIGSTYQYSGKLICKGTSKGTIRIEKVGVNIPDPDKKISEANSKGDPEYIDMAYAPGDILKYTSISGDYSTVSMDIPASDKMVTFNFISCTDGDNNNYPVVEIGSQTWMAENLKTTKYRDGTDIPLVVNNPDWGNLTTAGFCWYNNDETTFKPRYGALYNWYAISSGEVCPDGWHVPDHEEWTTLTTFLGGESVAGGKLKETGISYWITPNAGANNETGFTALPGDARYLDGTYKFFGTYCHFWSSTEDTNEKSWLRYLMNDWEGVANISADKNYGLSVRCLKDKIIKSEEAYPGIEGTVLDFEVNGETITCEKINDEYVFQGDIILTEEQLMVDGKSKGAGYSSLARLWPEGIVYYEINENLPDVNRVTEAIYEYETSTNIKFIKRTDQFSYVEFIRPNDGLGTEWSALSSNLGMILGKQTIKIGDNSRKGEVMHEIGHAIGLIHEHSRKDRDNYVIIHTENIENYNKNWQQFKKINNSDNTVNYDFYSIMGYDSWAFAKGDLSVLPTITKLDGSFIYCNRERLTTTDIEMINTLYGDYQLEYISGNNQTYSGGGMPYPMVFKIKNIAGNDYVTSLGEGGFSLEATAATGFQDAEFNNLNDYCGNGDSSCFGGYYYIPPNTAPGWTLYITVILKKDNKVISVYTITENII